jgi:hypothetical protein
MAPRRIVLVLGLAVAGCGDDAEHEAAGPPPAVDLRVRLDRDGRGPREPVERRVRCASAQESEACRAALALEPAAFEPVPHDQVCTLQYGGPQEARVSGTLRGERVDGRFSRRNGCEIARWEKVEPLLP